MRKGMARIGRDQRPRGFSIIELMVAVTVVSVGIMPLLTMVARFNNSLMQGQARAKAAIWGEDILNVIEHKQWDETSVDGEYTATPSAIGVDQSETAVALYDDVDDFNGFNDKPAEGITRVVEVGYVAVDVGTGVVIPSVAPTDLKLVRVTVTWPQNGGMKTSVVETLRANGV